MRKLVFLAAALVACTKAETPAADSTTAMAPAPIALTAADVAGSWKGVTMGETSDSVTSRWTTARMDDKSGTLTVDGQKDAISYTTVFDADSMVATSAPYANPADAKAPKLMFRSVARMKDGKLVGTSATMLADKPDSVVARGRFEATKAP